MAQGSQKEGKEPLLVKEWLLSGELLFLCQIYAIFMPDKNKTPTSSGLFSIWSK